MAEQKAPLPKAPVTREEAYLNAIAKQDGGGDSITIDENLFLTNTNTVQNKTITQTFGIVDMLLYFIQNKIF